MTEERWGRIQRLFHEARALPADERRTFLAGACEGDAELQREVQVLLDQPLSTEGFMELAAGSQADQSEHEAPANLTGRQLGSYRVISLLGQGGMGEVYQAHDSRLRRDVAIKVLPPRFTRDAERLARFESEARILAAINHPHIGAIYGVEDVEGLPALVLELVDGDTLSDRLRRGRPAVREALAIARQIADALDAAHRKSIIHRDLKPANIKVTPEGIVKILDFGLAKAVADDTAPPRNLSQAPTTISSTRIGTILGTAAYMSPEQARGLAVDTRTDIWAFGCVLYEMLAGRSPFSGNTVAETLSAIFEREPDWSALPSSTPSVVRDLLRRCLQKDLGARLPNIGEARAVIDRVQQGRNRWKIAAVSAAAMTLVVAVVGVYVWRTAARSGPITSSAEYEQMTDLADSAAAPSLSPDGRMVTFKVGESFFLGPGNIYVKLLPNGESVPLTHAAAGRYGPVFTPDGTRVAYTQLFQTSNGLTWDTLTVPLLGGEPTRMLPNASGLTFLRSGRVLFAEIRGGLHMGIVAAMESRADARDIYFPPHQLGMAHFAHASPDGKSVIVVEMDQTHAFGLPCRLVPADGGSPGRTVGPRGTCTSAAWSPEGHWMYFGATVGGRSHLWRQRFPEGEPEQITSGPTEEEGVAVTPDGKAVITALGLRRSSILIHDGAGERSLVAEGYATRPRLSIDGQRLFFLLRSSADVEAFELRVLEIATGRVATVLPGVPILDYDVSRDGASVAFTRRDHAESEVWLAPLDRSRAPGRVASNADQVSFGANGELIVRSVAAPVNTLMRIRGDGAAPVRIASPIVHEKGEVSGDGQWVIVYSPGTGPGEPVATFAVPVTGGPARRICMPYCDVNWSADGRHFSVGVNLDLASGAPARTIVVPLETQWSIPDLPPAGVHAIFDYAALAGKPGAQTLQHGHALVGIDPRTYVFTNAEFHTNLFRIPLRRQ